MLCAPVAEECVREQEDSHRRYEAQKPKWRSRDTVQPALNPGPNTVSYNQSSLIHLVGPSEYAPHGFVHGGEVSP